MPLALEGDAGRVVEHAEPPVPEELLVDGAQSSRERRVDGGPEGDGLQFWGGSFVSDPQGRMLAKAGDGEETLIVECDPRTIEHVRRNWPFLRDRRIDAYGPIVNRVID